MQFLCELITIAHVQSIFCTKHLCVSPPIVLCQYLKIIM